MSQLDFKEGSTGNNRARQFMPFMALKGYFDLCREKERVAEPRHELTEEEALALSERVASLRKGHMVRVRAYDGTGYVSIQGIVTEVVPALRFMRVVRRQIDFDDILSIDVVE